ncbi:MAG: peptidylprolyl isomerase [Planctomyces sp.]|nr:peptidylprolyl isomerase [Planctomyces sp.]MBA4119917.1 peptidylprolyl isomerase [Isosphaera sp.]
MVLTGLRVYADKLVRMETDAGGLLIRLRPDEAPNTAWNFRELAGGGFYNGVVFHRVVPVGRTGGGFVIQGGDPSGTGEGGPGYEIDLERSGLAHDFGVVSMARDRQPNTGGSQFFVCLTRQETARLDGLYTAFGEVISGEGTIAAIAALPLEPGEANRPVTPPRIVRAELVDAPPAGTGPGRVRLGSPSER